MSPAHRIPLSVFFCLACFAQSMVGDERVADDPSVDAQDFAGTLEIPEIARYTKLPTRLLLRSEFQHSETTEYLPEEYVQFFVRMLDGNYDNELYRDVAQSLEIIGHKNLAAPELYVQSLRNRLNNTDSRIVTRACVLALIAANDSEFATELSKYCQPSDEILCAHIEPKLADWNSKVLVETWQTRLNNLNDYSDQLLILACQCLGTIKHSQSSDKLASITADETVRFPVRKAAAEAAGTLDPANAAALAKTLAEGETLHRLLAVTLLQHTDSPEQIEQLAELCDDLEDAIASIAWDSLEQQNRQRLVTKLEQGIAHQESNVRKTAVRVMAGLPSGQHNKWLNQLLADKHIEVRNLARAGLHQVAANRPKLRPQIVELAGRNLSDSKTNWQQIEQSLILLGQQMHPDFLADCIPLLKHPRNEVIVSAAWLLHLMPRQELTDQITGTAYEQFAILKDRDVEWAVSNSPRLKALSHEVKFLFHASGFLGDKNIRNLSYEMFSKEAPTLPETRAAGLWALGMAFAETTDTDMQKQWMERLHDDSVEMPEREVVKAASALSLGLQQMESSIDSLELAHRKYGIGGEVGLSVSTSLRAFGKTPPTPAELPPKPLGNWRVAPLLKQD